MNTNPFFPLGLLSNTSTYYGPLEYTVKLGNKSNTLDSTFSLRFNSFSDPIPNTIDQIVHTWPEIKELVSKLDIYDQVTFTTSIGCWTMKDGHLATFEDDLQREFHKSRFGKTFYDTQVIGVRELKQEYNIVDERDEQVKAYVGSLITQFEAIPTQEYLVVELVNLGLGLDPVSNYSLGYKCAYKSLELGSDFQTIKITWIITDYYKLANTQTADLGSQYTMQIKLPNDLPDGVDGLLTHSPGICMRVPSLNSENFDGYLQLVDKLKNWPKYNQVDMFAKEILGSKSVPYIKYVNKILGCETKINSLELGLGMEYVEQLTIPGLGEQFDGMGVSPFDPNETLGESFY